MVNTVLQKNDNKTGRNENSGLTICYQLKYELNTTYFISTQLCLIHF
jgi:hypothetical protein